MKQILLKTWLMLVCLLMGAGTMWAEEQTATLTFTAACGGSGTDDKGNSWTVTSDASESTYDETKGIHYGTSKAAVSYLKLANSSITGTITKIVVNASGASGTSAKIDVKVGGSAFGSQQSLTSSNAAYTFNGSASGNIEISLTQTSATKALYVKSVAVTYSTAADTRTAVNMTAFSAASTTLIKGENTSTTVSNDLKDWTPSYTYESSNTSVATVDNDGVITAVAKGTARITASLNIANDDATWKKGATALKTIDITVNNPSYTAHFSVNGTIDPTKDARVEEGSAITFPSDPAVDDVVFKGWATAAIDGTQDDAPTFVNTATETMGTNDVTYYAVFAVKNTDSSTATGTGLSATTSAQTLEAGKPITYKSSAANSYSDPVRIYKNGTFTIAGATMTRIVLEGDDSSNPATNLVLKSGEPGSISTGTNTVTWTGSATSVTFVASSAQARVKKITATYGDATYSDYCTTVSLDPQPTIVLSATELSEYAGNTNTSITASVSEGEYTGALSVESSAEAVATASISEGTITVNALTAGNATITVTAPAVTGFRKNTATIAVTVSEKLAHGLSFDAATLNLTVGDTEFSEPTLNNPNRLPVVYSLVYATPANEGKVATINSETGKLTLADPSLSTETQGAVTVKASTIGDNSHAAGEVTYNLVVARKVTTTSWSNEGAAVTIDKDEIATLPTASNDGERNLFYESSNEDVAKFVDGVLTFVDYGTTTITAKTTATAEYAATSATYELTFAPRYTVTFNVNGNETELREETTGAGVTAPTVEPIEGKVFRGWAEATIDGTADIAPTFVTTTSLDGDKILYAVFATASVGDATDAEGSADFSSSVPTGWTTSGTATYFSKPVGMKAANANIVNNNISDFKNYASSANTITIGVTSLQNGGTSSKLTVYLVDADGNTVGTGKVITPVNANDANNVTNQTVEFNAANAAGYMVKCTTFDKNILITASSYTINYNSTAYSDYCTTVKTTPVLSFAELTYNTTLIEGFAAPELTNEQNVTVSYTSSVEGVATVDSETGAITLVGAGTTTITATFEGNAAYKATSASYELVVTAEYTRDGLTPNSLGTICLPYAVSADEVAKVAETVAFYEISHKVVEGKTVKKVMFTPATELVAGMPYIFYTEAESFTLQLNGPATAAGNKNGLYGALTKFMFADTYEAGKYYVISSNKIQAASRNSGVNANRAYIIMNEVPAEPTAESAGRLLSIGANGFEFEEGILTGVEATITERSNEIYDFQGRRVVNAKNGMYIVNGKKVIR